MRPRWLLIAFAPIAKPHGGGCTIKCHCSALRTSARRFAGCPIRAFEEASKALKFLLSTLETICFQSALRRNVIIDYGLRSSVGCWLSVRQNLLVTSSSYLLHQQRARVVRVAIIPSLSELSASRSLSNSTVSKQYM